MAQGLIAAALGGFGKALATAGEMEAKKQNEAKLRKELMAMESEERLRLDEVMYERKKTRMPEEARIQAEANVGAEAAGFAAADKANLPAIRAKADVGRKTAQYAAEDAADLTTIEAKRAADQAKTVLRAKSEAGLPEAQGAYAAREKIEARLAELNFSKLKNLSALEAQTKYDALIADIDAAEKSNIDVREAKRRANAILADINAKKETGVPKAEAGYKADQRTEEAKALEEKGVYKVEAQGAANKRLEEIRAMSEKNIVTEEANLLAKQELAKVQAMTAQGVPEAEAKLLAAKWRAGKTQRDEAAAEKTQQEITDSITKARNKDYMGAERKQAVNKRVVSDSGTKEKEKVTTADLSRKLQVAEDELAEALGVSDKKKVNEEIRLLTEMANSKKNPDPEAKQKLKDIEQLRANVKRRRDELQNWRDKPEENKSGSGNKPGIESFNK